MKRLVAFSTVPIALVTGGFLWVTAPDPLPASRINALQGDADQGRSVFLAAGCGSCHMAPDRTADPLVLSGGRAFQSAFGTFLAPNISPDPEHGIGAWDQVQFVNAVMRGVSPEGRHYYPAFPYTAYIKADMQDIVDLYAYMQTLPADATPSRAHDLGFPYGIRRGVGLWKALFLSEDWVVTGPMTPAEERGRYLAEALSHCAECHTPRNTLGALDHDRWMLGAPNPSGQGRIPPIAGPEFTWTHFDISAYLETGFTPDFDVVGGTMADVVTALGQLEKADLDAIAAYILRIDE